MWPKAKLGMAMLLLAEGVFFFMLLLAFLYFRDESVKASAATLNLRITSIYTACLLISGVAIWRARVAIAILFGGVFLVGQGIEYVRMLRQGVTMGQGLFGTTFLTLAGMHSLHVVIGLALLLVLRRSVASAMFWQFVVAVWAVIFAVVYIGSLA
jgi:cytochrome c oxidase subunit III